MIDELMFEILSEKRHTENTLELLSKGEYIARMPKETPLHQSTEFLERLSALTSTLQKFMLDTAIPEETKNAWIRNCYWPHTSNKQELTNQGKRFYHLLCSLYIQAGLNEWKHSRGDQNKLSILKDIHAHNFSKTPKSFAIDKQLMDVPGEEDTYFYIALAPKYVKKLITCFFYGSATEEQKKWVNNTLCNVLPSSLIPIVYGYLGGVCNEILEKIESKKADSIELLEIDSLTLRF